MSLLHSIPWYLWWPLVSAVINVALDLKPLSAWVSDAEKNPRVASFASLMSAIGLDPLACVQAVVNFVTAKAAAPLTVEISSNDLKEDR